MPKRALLFTIVAAAAFSACTDQGLIPTESTRLPDRVGEIRPHFTTLSEADALQISDPYAARDLLSPFNVSYDEFFDDPEAISDAQFDAQVPHPFYEWEIDQIETDAARVYEYCSSASGGGPDDEISMTSIGDDGTMLWEPSCEQKLERCWSRCRRIPSWNRHVRAGCWAGCMAGYALCVRRRSGR